MTGDVALVPARVLDGTRSAERPGDSHRLVRAVAGIGRERVVAPLKP